METYRTYLLSKNAHTSQATLEAYLMVVGEDWGKEFKRAGDDADYLPRKAVASLANHGGGEVFFGVRDTDRALIGTALTQDTLRTVLRQEHRGDEGFIFDLGPLIEFPNEVPLDTIGARVLVAEVRPAPAPALVVEDDGTLIWYVRDGRSDRRLAPVEWVRESRKSSRCKLLLELFRELDAAVRAIPYSTDHGARVGEAYFSLLRFEQARSDGTLFSLLTDEDRGFLYVSGPPERTGYGSRGILPRFVGAGQRIDRAVDLWNARGRTDDWEIAVGNHVRSAREDATRDVEDFARYLRALGALPPGR